MNPYITVITTEDIAVDSKDIEGVQVYAAATYGVARDGITGDGTDDWEDPGPPEDPFGVFYRSARELMASDGRDRLVQVAARAAGEHTILRVELEVMDSVDAAVLDRLRLVCEDVGVPAVELFVRRRDA